MLEAKEDITRTKQRDGKNNNNYIKRFKEQLEIIRHYEGSFGDDAGLVKYDYRKVNEELKSVERDNTIWKK